jgi:rhamnulokinase
MSQFYVCCHLGEEVGRVMLGHLHKEKLQLSEVRHFSTAPLIDRDSAQWNIPQIYQEVMDALRSVAAYEEPVHGISCTSCAGDYLLFDGDGALITPAVHHTDAHAEAARKKVLSRVPWEVLYEETGTVETGPNMFLQLGSESSRRLRRAKQVSPVADGFNFLLGGEARIELSMASASQLYNPVSGQWSMRLLEALKLHPGLFPPVVTSGTVLGRLKEEICKETGLEDTQVVATCSEETAAAMSGLPFNDGERWAFLTPGKWTLVGSQVPQPIINEASRQLNFTNRTAFDGSVCFYKRTNGLQILEECQRYWEERDRSLDQDLLSHLAGSATPFESLIDPSDPRFLTPGDMPLKIQAFCKETDQPVPRKPGPVYRTVLESLALHYRKLFCELQHFTETEFEKIYVLSAGTNMLLNHFTANALQIPVTVLSGDVAALGNVVVQALALCHIPSIEHARALLRHSSKTETIVPHACIWEQAYDRFVALSPAAAVPA